MNAILLGASMLAVAWLVIWTGKDHSRPSRTWWLFAMREAASPKKTGLGPGRASLPQRAGAGLGASGSDQRPWRRSGS
jgi:hypothetical protein